MHRKVKNNSTYPTLDICAFLSYHVYYQNEMEVYYMIIELGLKGNERKELAKEVSEIIGAPAEYQYMPTCAYKIGRDYTVTKEGNLEISDSADSKEARHLIDELGSRGYDVPLDEEENGLTVEMPLELVDKSTLERLRKIVENKGELFKAAFKTDNFEIIVEEDKVCFPWFTVEQYDDTSAYCTFISLLCEFAKNQSRINNKPDTSNNPKYTMRCYLLRLGMIGAEYKDTRRVLLRNLSGSSAFRKVGDSDEVSE